MSISGFIGQGRVKLFLLVCALCMVIVTRCSPPGPDLGLEAELEESPQSIAGNLNTVNAPSSTAIDCFSAEWVGVVHQDGGESFTVRYVIEQSEQSLTGTAYLPVSDGSSTTVISTPVSGPITDDGVASATATMFAGTFLELRVSISIRADAACVSASGSYSQTVLGRTANGTIALTKY